ncbi:MAG: site-specific integrase, partial [Lactococcus lactis]|nr:site-specific integrase [Lactococcus lactis]
INDADCPRSKLERSKSTLNLIFDYAVDLEYIEYNPARKAKLPKKIQTVKDLEKIQNKYLEQNELKALLSELYSRPNTRRLALLAEFMSLNGCRMGEAIALKKENYKRSERKIDIHGTLDKTVGYSKGVKTTPKTASSFRTVDLSDREIEILDEIIEQNNLSKSVRNDYNEMGYIFVSKRGIPLQTNSFNLAIKRANSRLKSPINKNLSSHIFRHTLISYLAENNVPLKAIVDRVGHKDGGKTTTAIYTHVTENMKSSIIDILNKKN